MRFANLLTLLISASLVIIPGASLSQSSAQESRSGNGNEYEVVVCLLPSVVRKLGTRFPYAKRQKPIETTAGDCEIRGGEYTAYDRSNYQTALTIWKAAAEAGDAEAQTKTGELYEKYLGAPDYAQAAFWYGKAAENGNPRAMRNLAYLYEHGLGVEQDLERSLSLWRQGLGLDEELVFASELAAVKSDAERKVAELTARLDEQNRKSRELQRDLRASVTELDEQMQAFQQSQRDIDSLRAALEEAQAAGPAVDPEADARVAGLRASLEQAQSAAEEHESTIALLQNELSAQRAQVDASAGSADIHERRLQDALASLAQERTRTGALQQEMAQKDAQMRSMGEDLESSNREIEAARRDSAVLESSLAELRQELTQAGEELVAQQRESAMLEKDLAAAATSAGAASGGTAQLEQALAAKEREIEQKKAAIDSLRDKWTTANAENEALELKLAESEDDRAVLQASLAQKDKEIIAHRAQLAEVRTTADQLNADRQGMEAERDELAARLGDAQAQQDENWQKWRGMYEAVNGQIAAKNEEISDLNMRVMELEITGDRLSGERVAFANAITRSFEAPQAVEIPSNLNMKQYDYHALIIGNWDYDEIQELPTVKNDVLTVKNVLEQRYGFDVNLQLNLNREGMLRELKELQEYDEDDFVLIYYAGHGLIDEFEKGFWLPTDFEEDKAPWATAVPVDQITQHVNRMKAKHVMLVVDSCYSGALAEGSSVEIRDVDRKLPFWIELPSRTVLTSNDLRPVLDSGGTGLSVFAEAFCDVLADNSGLIPGETLAARVSAQVREDSLRLDLEQDPQFSALRDAGHANGQFVFYPHVVVAGS